MLEFVIQIVSFNTMYQLLPDSLLGPATCVKRVADNAYISMDLDNKDYQAYLDWVAEGNVPLPVEETTA